MADNQRVAQLLEEILDSERTTEDVCAPYPDLLPEVQRRLREIYAVDAGLKALFPRAAPEQRDLRVHVNDAFADTGSNREAFRAESPQLPLGLPIPETAEFDTDFRSFERLLLEMPRQRSVDVLLRVIVQRLAERPHVALARIWLLQPGDICPTCPMRQVCPDQAACLHLAASAGRSLQDQREWSHLDGAFRRMPLGVRKVGLIAARGEAIQVADLQPDAPWLACPEWVHQEGIGAFGGQPLLHNGQVLGVLAVFFRARLVGEVLMWLRIIADQAATAIASARAFEELDRLRRRLRSDTGAEPGHQFPTVVPNKAPLSPGGQALFAAGKGWPTLPGYEILNEVGRGGMGIVYRARQFSLDRIVAIKVIPLGLTGQDEVVARFHQEERLAARLVHPNLVTAYDAGQIAGLPFLVMEFVAGANLAERVEQCGPLSLSEACEVVRQAAFGLQHIHEQGLVHRDVKPSNLMLTPQGQVKVLDLGVARLLKPNQGPHEGPISAYGQFLGTLDYMAPEQCADSRSADIRSDIYSLGCTLYFLLAGRPPFAPPDFQSIYQKMKAHAEVPAPSIRNLHPNSPPALAAILERMLAKDPAGRFSCPAEVALALQPFAAG
jgi:hypothetical protein